MLTLSPTASALLVFDDIWVHGRRPLTIDSSNTLSNASTSTAKNILYKLTQKTSSRTISKKVNNHQSANKQVLITAANGQLLESQLTVLTGPSGSGKSVLLRVLAGLSPLTSGNIYLHNTNRINGSDKLHNAGNERLNSQLSIDDMPAPKWRAQVALLAQHPQLIEGSVLDNLQLPYTLQAHHHSSFNIDWHIQQLDFLQRNQAFLQQSATHLSGGERQLLNTLRLLQLQPRVLLLDEPTAALDADTANNLIQLLMHWLQAEPRRAMLWVTHDTQAIMPLADQHWDMQAGILNG